MIRENNRKEFVREDDDVPEFGAGSEFGRKEKEERVAVCLWAHPDVGKVVVLCVWGAWH